MSEEMLYDDVAMENVRSLLASADSQLKLASSNYSSSKLNGSALLADAEGVINEIAPYLRSYGSATDNIYTGSTSGVNFQTTQAQTTANTQNISTENSVANLTLEEIDNYEKELQDSLDLCDEIIRVCQEEEDLLNTFLENYEGGYYGSDTSVTVLTPEEYEEHLISVMEQSVLKYNEDGTLTEEYIAELEKIKKYVQEYRTDFEAAFEEFAGVSYSEFSERLNGIKEMLASAYSGKYALNQKMKEIPFLRIAKTDEYQNFASQNNDLSSLKATVSDWYYLEDDTIKSYLTEEQQIMLLYLIENERKATLGLDGYDESLPLYYDYIEALEDSINSKKGQREAEEILNTLKDKNGKINFTVFNSLIMAEEGFKDGISGFGDGIVNCLRTEAMISDTQYKQMYLLTELEKLANKADATVLNFSYQHASTIGNMAIPMLLSFSGVGSLISSGLMGASAGGNAKNQALVDGYSTRQAVLYGIFSGLSETVVGWTLGKIPGLSKASGFTLKNIFEEGLEEFSQEWFDAGLRAILFNEDIDGGELMADSLKSFAMGALVAAELNGAAAISIRIKAKIYDIPFSDVKKMCKNNPDLSPVDALMQIVETCAAEADTTSTIAADIRGKISSIIEEKGLGRMDQHVLDRLFNLDTDSFFINERAKSIAIDYMTKNKSAILNSLQSAGAPLEIFDRMYRRFSNPDTTVVEYRDVSNFCNFFRAFRSELEVWDEFYSNVKVADLSKDESAIKIRKGMYEYFSKKGLSESDVNTIFKSPDDSTGGVCDYGAISEVIAQQLSEEQFEEHFGFKKFAELDGKKIYNPTLMADMFFEINKEGNAREPSIVRAENGGWKLIDGITENGEFKAGKLRKTGLATRGQAYHVDEVNQYLATKGLKTIEVEKQASQQFLPSYISGVPETGVNTSVETLKPIVEKSLKEGLSIKFGIQGGNLINIETGEIKNFDGKRHAVNMVGIDDNGFRVSTYNGEWIYPFADVKNGDILNEKGDFWFNGANVNYSVIKIEELS